MGRIHRQVGRRRSRVWAPINRRIRRRNEWYLVSMVGRLLRRRTMGPREEKLERPGNVSGGLSLRSGSRACARRVKYQVDVSHQQLSLSVRNLELCACLLSRLGLRRLARPERLRATIQGRAQSGYSITFELAVLGNVQARSA